MAGLNYIIPPGNNNCGAGGAVDDMVPTDVAPSVSGPIATDVATGYTETLAAYLAVRDEDAAVKAANKALSDLLKADTPSDVLITAARETLAAAQTKQAAAHAKLYAVGDGPINMAGIAEWRAKFAVEDAVLAWNTAVGKSWGGRNGLEPYGPMPSTYRLPPLSSWHWSMTMATINLMLNVREYANAEGDNTSVQDAMDR